MGVGTNTNPDGSMTTGQRLGRIEDRLDTVLTEMGKKAEEADVRALDARVSLLERQEAVAAALRTNRRWMIGTALGLAGWGSAIIAVVAFLHH